MRKLITSIALCLIVITSSRAFAQTLAGRVPADSFAYFGWKGYQTPGSGYDGSNLQAVLGASNIKALFDDVLPQLIELAAKQSPDAKTNIQTAMTIAGPLFKHPTAIFVRPGPDPQMPVRAGLICQAGDDAPALLKQLTDTFAKAPDLNSHARISQADGFVTVLMGYSDADAKATLNRAQMLSGSARFADAAKLAGAKMGAATDSFLTIYLDADAAASMITKGMEQAPPSARLEFDKIREASGLAGLHRVFISANFDAKNWATQSFVDAPAPRKGFLKLLEGRPVEADIYKLIPVTSASADVARFDLAALANQIRTLMGIVDPVNGEANFDNAMDVAQQFTGLHPVNDVLQPLGDTWVSFSDEKIAGNDSMGLVYINPLRDAATAEKSLTTLWGLATNMLNGPMGAAAHGQLSIGEEKVQDLTVHTIETPQFTAGWTIKNGKLFIGFKADGAVAAANAPPQTTGFDQNPQFAEMSKKLSGGNTIDSFRFSDLTVTAPLMYPHLEQAWGMLRMVGGMQGIDLPDSVLPTLDALKPHLSPSVEVSWSDATGFQSRSISPFPGADAFSNAPNQKMITIGMTGVGVSILLPSLSRSRETANRVKCASNERQIGQAILLYSNENKDAFPPDLGELAKTQDITLDAFVCPDSGTTVPANSEKMTPDERADWVNKNSDYIYAGKGLMNTSTPADRVVLYEKETDHGGDGMNMLYGDGHVEFQRMTDAKKLIEDLKGK